MRTVAKSLALIGGSGMGIIIGCLLGVTVGVLSRPPSTVVNPGDYINGIQDLINGGMHVLLHAMGGSLIGFVAGLVLAAKAIIPGPPGRWSGASSNEDGGEGRPKLGGLSAWWYRPGGPSNKFRGIASAAPDRPEKDSFPEV